MSSFCVVSNFFCEICAKSFANQGSFTRHMKSSHKNDVSEETTVNETNTTTEDLPPLPITNDDDLDTENEVLEDFVRDEELLVVIENMVNEAFEVEKDKEKETKEELVEKIIRFKVIMEKKNNFMKQSKEAKDNMEHELELVKQVEGKQFEEL